MFRFWILCTSTSFAVLVSGTRSEARPGLPGGETDDGASCTARHGEIAKIYASLPPPESYQGLTPGEADALGAAVEKGLESCRTYLAKCSGGESKEEKERTAEVWFYRAKFLFLLSARYQNRVIAENQNLEGSERTERVREQMAAYYGVIADAAENALENLPEDSAFAAPALQLLGGGRAESGDHAAAKLAYERFLEKHAGHELHASILAALGRTMIRLEDYDVGIELLKKGLGEKSVDKSPSYPYVVETLWKLYESKGDPSGMLEVCEAIAKIFPYRMKDPSRNAHEREDYRRCLVYNGFRRGYALTALGSFVPARRAWESYIADLANEETGGAKLPPYAQIYLKRARDSLEFLETKCERPPPVGLDLANLWVTPKQVALDKARGKVVAIVFRGSGDSRSAPFLSGLDEIVATDPLVQLAAIHYLKSTNDISGQMDALLLELAGIDYRSAAGFDPDGSGKRIFRAFGANVGSATFFVIDPAGNLVWFQQDPRGIDVNLAKSIIDRVKPAK